MPVAKPIEIKAKVFDMLTAALTDFTVTWGFTKRDVPRTWCYLGEMNWPGEEWATNRSREYTVSIPIILNAIKARTTPRQGEEWLAAQFDIVEAAFGPDSDLRSVGAVTWSVAPRHFGSQPHTDGLECQAAIELRVTYRP